MRESAAIARVPLWVGPPAVWALTGTLAIVAVGLYFGVLHDLPAPTSDLQVPWYVLAAMFALAEAVVVNVQFRRDAHTISVGELPLVVGLYAVAPGTLLLAQLVGCVVALRFYRRQSAMKLAFNAAHFALEAAIAVIIVSLVPAADLFGPRGWGAVMLATVTAAVVAVVAMFAAMTLAEGQNMFTGVRRELGTAVMFTATNTSVALLAVWMLRERPTAVLLLLVPAGVLWVAYRAWIQERERSDRLRFLYEVTQAISGAADGEDAVRRLLHHARAIFRAELAELTLYPPEANDEDPLRSTLAAGKDELVTRPVPGVHRRLRHGASQLFAAGWDHRAAPDLAQRGVRDAMVVPLVSDDVVFGEILIADRACEVSTFNVDDMLLLETLAAQASVCLENGRLEHTLAQLITLKEQLRHQAFHDSLTGLVNRALFHDRVAHALGMRARDHGTVLVLVIDLDDFKSVNDSLGHAAGDQLLVDVAERLTRCLRPGDTAARLSGDEFAVLLPQADDVRTAVAVAERIHRALSLPVILQGLEVAVHASIGIARSESEDDAATLLGNADVAMYEAKQQGKNGYSIYERGMHRGTRERLELRGQLRTAVEHDQFRLRYQPVVDVVTGAVVGAEALVRWQHPTRGLLTPDAFITYAEETGLIVPLGAWVLDRALERMAQWVNDDPERMPGWLAVNLSPRQLLHPGLVDEVCESLARHAVPAQSLVLEITESALIRDTPATLRMLRDLKSLGLRIAVDDFGTGYSALSYLRQFPIDMLKISKPFVDDVGSGREERAVTEAIVSLGRALGLETIAEGVERPEQVTALQEMGCTFAQGFHFARPLSGEAFEWAIPGPRLRSVGGYAN